MVADDLDDGAGASANAAGDDRDLGQVGQADPGQVEAGPQAAADLDATIDEPTATLDRVRGDLTLLGARQERLDDPKRPSVQVHRASSAVGWGGMGWGGRNPGGS